MNWLINNLGTIIAAAIVLGVVTLIIVKYFKNKRAGKSTCSCGCANCPLSGRCH